MIKETLEAFLELESEEHLGHPEADPEGQRTGNSSKQSHLKL
jgi:putative transposase